MGNYCLSEKDIVSKLALIEQHMGRCPFGFYEPSIHFKSADEILVQKEASMMMKHVGLNHHVACITYVETSDNTGGNIELDNSNNVFIDISRNIKGQDAKVLAVMAHEICHKALFVHGLYYPNLSIENEILTDLATIYVGFGKLSLNGCYSKNAEISKEYKDGKDIETYRKITDFIGYLSLSQFAQAYNIVCGCNGTHSIMLNGLTPSAKEMVTRYSFNIQKPITTTEIKQVLKSIQTDDAKIINYINTIERIIHTIKNKIKDNQKQYNKDLVLPFKLDRGFDIIDYQMKAAEALSKYEITQYSPDTDKLNAILKHFIIDYKNVFETDDSHLLNIECPCCGFIKNNGLKEYKEIFVKCPNCGHLFVWNAINDYRVDNKDNIRSEESKIHKDKEKNNIDESLNNKMCVSSTYTEPRNEIMKYLIYIFVIAFLLSFIPICVYISIPWIYKVMLVFPYSLIYFFLVKKLLPDDFDAPFDVKGEYNGGDFNVDYRGIGETLMGKFGSGSSAFFSVYKGEYGAFRTYVFFTILFIMIPVNCLVLKEDAKPEDELMNKRNYKVYGTSKWYLLEVVWLYLRKYCYIAAIIIIVYFLDYLWNCFK